MTKRSRVSPVKAAFTFEGHTGRPFAVLAATAQAATEVGGNLTRAMTAAFAAALCADQSMTVKTASALIGDKCPESKESGHPAATRKAWAASFFKDSANLAKLRAAIPRPEGMDAGDFATACNTFAEANNVRAAYQAKLTSNKASKDQAEGAKANTSAGVAKTPTAEEVAERERVALQTPRVLEMRTEMAARVEGLAALMTPAPFKGPRRTKADKALANTVIQDRANAALEARATLEALAAQIAEALGEQGQQRKAS